VGGLQPALTHIGQGPGPGPRIPASSPAAATAGQTEGQAIERGDNSTSTRSEDSAGKAAAMPVLHASSLPALSAPAAPHRQTLAAPSALLPGATSGTDSTAVHTMTEDSSTSTRQGSTAVLLATDNRQQSRQSSGMQQSARAPTAISAQTAGSFSTSVTHTAAVNAAVVKSFVPTDSPFALVPPAQLSELHSSSSMVECRTKSSPAGHDSPPTLSPPPPAGECEAALAPGRVQRAVPASGPLSGLTNQSRVLAGPVTVLGGDKARLQQAGHGGSWADATPAALMAEASCGTKLPAGTFPTLDCASPYRCLLPSSRASLRPEVAAAASWPAAVPIQTAAATAAITAAAARRRMSDPAGIAVCAAVNSHHATAAASPGGLPAWPAHQQLNKGAPLVCKGPEGLCMPPVRNATVVLHSEGSAIDLHRRSSTSDLLQASPEKTTSGGLMGRSQHLTTVAPTLPRPGHPAQPGHLNSPTGHDLSRSKGLRSPPSSGLGALEAAAAAQQHKVESPAVVELTRNKLMMMSDGKVAYVRRQSVESHQAQLQPQRHFVGPELLGQAGLLLPAVKTDNRSARRTIQ